MAGAISTNVGAGEEVRGGMFACGGGLPCVRLAKGSLSAARSRPRRLSARCRAGKSIDSQDIAGSTALMHAAANRCGDVARPLPDAGAEAKDRAAKTALCMYRI